VCTCVYIVIWKSPREESAPSPRADRGRSPWTGAEPSIIFLYTQTLRRRRTHARAHYTIHRIIHYIVYLSTYNTSSHILYRYTHHTAVSPHNVIKGIFFTYFSRGTKRAAHADPAGLYRAYQSYIYIYRSWLQYHNIYICMGCRGREIAYTADASAVQNIPIYYIIIFNPWAGRVRVIFFFFFVPFPFPRFIFRRKFPARALPDEQIIMYNIIVCAHPANNDTYHTPRHCSAPVCGI